MWEQNCSHTTYQTHTDLLLIIEQYHWHIYIFIFINYFIISWRDLGNIVRYLVITDVKLFHNISYYICDDKIGWNNGWCQW